MSRKRYSPEQIIGMLRDKDVWRTAKLLLDQYGADAATHAAIRADAMLGAGDMERQAVWKRIVRAIEELQAARTWH